MEIIAFNINTGGAKVLLNLLVEKINNQKMPCNIYIENEDVIENTCLSKTILPIFISNYFSGLLLLLKSHNNSIFFGNLPPFRKSERTILYLHNEYLTLSLNEIYKQKISFKSKVKLLSQIMIIKLFHRNVTHVAVQTNHMAVKLNSMLNREILILPFFDENILPVNSSQKYFDFCYVGLPSKHKNHETLLIVIRNLINKNCKFSIALTVPINQDNNQLLSDIKYLNRVSPGCIQNFGFVSKQTVQEIYSKSRALIFPSKKESLGLPIIEALQHDLKILSSNMEFSYEIIENPIVFDPDNINQIEMTMKSFMDDKYNSIQQSLKIKSHIDTIIKLISV